jgi:hypothetical protein
MIKKLPSFYVTRRFIIVRFKVLTATSMKMTAFWDVAPLSLVEVDQCFRDAYCLHHQGDDALMMEAVRIWSLS